jgi:molybdenum cofactor synthesis domain-containing protein
MAEVAETAAALIIGNELLSGKIHESNLIELARTLRALGVALRRVVMIPDEVELIAAEVNSLRAGHDILFTSGGIGPTHDDVTIESVARAFGVGVHIDPTMAAMLESAYGERCTAGHLRMAMVPEGATLKTTADERWPLVVKENVWILPGVPEIFRSKLSVVRELIVGPRPFASRAAFTNLDEGALKPLIDRVVQTHGTVEVGSYPKWFDKSYKTKVTFDSRDEAAVDSAFEAFVGSLPEGALVRVE